MKILVIDGQGGQLGGQIIKLLQENFAEADRIRDELASKGVTLLDTREGTKWTKE